MKPYLITDGRVQQFVTAAKEIFSNENCLKIELMRCVAEHPNHSREQKFFLRVLEELKFYRN